jgi:hypothetical protein
MEYGWKRPPVDALMDHALKDDFIEAVKAKGGTAWRAEIVARVWNEGIAKQGAEFLLSLLARRELTVPAEARERILSCVDLEQLGVWIEKAATGSSAEDIFTD